MRRLYSPFVPGLPGAGLFIMRIVAGSVLVARGFEELNTGLFPGSIAVHIVRIALGLLIIAGLWTPVAGVLVAATEFGWLVFDGGDRWIHLFVGTLGTSLALLGPGVWSVDSRLFGWQRINIDKGDRHRRR